jgi:hypothetical protein
MTEITMKCENCLRPLSVRIEQDSVDVSLYVESCSTCRKRAFEAGWKEGVAKYLNEVEEEK